jgi:hypothetical protein
MTNVISDIINGLILLALFSGLSGLAGLMAKKAHEAHKIGPMKVMPYNKALFKESSKIRQKKN